MTSVIIQHIETGERQIVADLDGYDEAQWEVLGIDREPVPNEEWDETAEAWVFNEARAAEQDELAEVTDRKRLRQFAKAARQQITELSDLLQQTRQQANTEITAIKARLDALEGN